MDEASPERVTRYGRCVDEQTPTPHEPKFPARPTANSPDRELARAASESLWFRRVRALCEWVGEGRELDVHEELSLTDAREVARLLDPDAAPIAERLGTRARLKAEIERFELIERTQLLAGAAGFIDVAERRLLRLPEARLLDEDPIEAWTTLFTAMLAEVAPLEQAWSDDGTLDWLAPRADRSLAAVLFELVSRPEGVSIGGVCDAVCDQLEQEQDPDEVEVLREVISDDVVESGLAHFAEFGAVDLNRDLGRVQLTPLGRTVLGRLATEADAALSGMSAEDALAVALTLDLTPAVGHLGSWLGMHPEGASALVDALLALAQEPVAGAAAGLVLHALLPAGPSVAAEVQRLGSEPTLTQYAAVWRLVQGLEPGPLPPTDDPERLVDRLSAVIMLTLGEDLQPALDRTVGRAGLLAALQAIWRVPRDETELVLECCTTLPDKKIAKAARRALFKRGSLPRTAVLHESGGFHE